jgi:hypothetical protein
MLQRDAIAIACTIGHPIGFDKKRWLRRPLKSRKFAEHQGAPDCNQKMITNI